MGQSPYLFPRLTVRADVALHGCHAAQLSAGILQGSRILGRSCQEDALAKEKIDSSKRGDAEQEWEKGDDQILRFNDMIYVPKDPALCQELLKIYHDDLLSSHFGEKKMLTVLRMKYFWLKIQKSIAAYCKT
ncbi:hypothetical protein VTO42DRAFT_4055 [Malbranchea cinnamomea]